MKRLITEKTHYSRKNKERGLKIVASLILMSIYFTTSMARDFTYEGLVYTVLDEEEHTCSTRSLWSEEQDGKYIDHPGNIVDGDIVIPSCVVDENNVEFKVVKIADSSFYRNKGLKSIVIPSTVTEIEWAAFSECDLLESVELPDQLKVIGPYAFSQCGNLKNISFPDSLDIIDEWSFAFCHSLESIKLPDNVGVRPYAFASSGLRYVKLPKYQINLLNGVFCWCHSLVTVIFPESLQGLIVYDSSTFFSYGAFYDCESLKSVKLPNSLETVGSTSFYGCTSLESLTLSTNLKDIDGNAFARCPALSEVIYPVTDPQEISPDYGSDRHPNSAPYGFSDETFENATLVVGKGGSRLASTRTPWKFFKHIEERDFSGVDEIESEPSAGNKEIYRMDGTKAGESIDALSSGLYIVRENGKSTKVMIP